MVGPNPPRLAVYGSLAPGERHHDQLEGLRGTWERATVPGRIVDRGWSHGSGYPGFIPDPSAESVEVLVFTSTDLDEAWDRLDLFEGREYERIVVLAELAGGTTVPAQIYALRRRAIRG